MAAYIIFTRESTQDAAELSRYAELAGPTAEGHPLTPLVFYGDFEVLEGAPIEGAVVLKFPDMAAARAWYQSPAYQAAREHRFKGAEYRVLLVDGMPSA